MPCVRFRLSSSAAAQSDVRNEPDRLFADGEMSSSCALLQAEQSGQRVQGKARRGARLSASSCPWAADAPDARPAGSAGRAARHLARMAAVAAAGFADRPAMAELPTAAAGHLAAAASRAVRSETARRFVPE